MKGQGLYTVFWANTDAAETRLKVQNSRLFPGGILGLAQVLSRAEFS